MNEAARPQDDHDLLVLSTPGLHVGDCQSDGPFLGPYYNTGPNTGPNLGDPRRDHHFDNPPCSCILYT